jgi:hypothetical protein
MNLRRNHFWLGGNVDQDPLSRFPKGIRVWLGGMRDLKEMWSSTMEERESEEQELFFVNRYTLEKKGGLIKPPRNMTVVTEKCHSGVARSGSGHCSGLAQSSSG